MKAKITKPSAPNIVKSIKDIKTGELYNYVEKTDGKHAGVVLMAKSIDDDRPFRIVEIIGREAGICWGDICVENFNDTLRDFDFTPFTGTITLSAE